MELNIRLVQESDNQSLKKIIRYTLKEYGQDKPGTTYTDYDTKYMYQAYQAEKSAYFVAEINGEVVGGAGLMALGNDFPNICELQKLYILPKARGLNVGKKLVNKVLETAIEFNYCNCYLESFDNMHAAISLYLKLGFSKIDYSMGNTGHSECNIWMLKKL